VKGPYHEWLPTTRPLPIACITKHNHSIVLTHHGGKQGILVMISIMQLSFIELVYVSAQPLHNVNITNWNPIEGYAIGSYLAQKGKN
jgi:hypothetical protein